MSEEPSKPSKPEDPIPDWVETVTRVAGALGFNKVRVRWKLQGWVNRRRAAARSEENAATHIRYKHRVCSHCHAVNDREEKVCTRCGQKLGSRAAEMLGRFGIHAPRALSVGSLIGVILVAAYVRIAAQHGGGISLPIGALIEHGGSLPLPYNNGEWWRSSTAVLLHAGLAHIAFNLFSLATIAPVAEDRFGRGVTLLLFMLTGTMGALVSAQLGPPYAVGVGASGAIMGLIGAVGGAGHRAGTPAGRAVRDDMIKWTIYVLLFGYMVGADNYAHAGGLLAGAAFGLAAPPKVFTRTSARGIQIAIGAVGLAWLLAATVAVMVPLQTDTWTPSAHDLDELAEFPTYDPGDPDDLATMVWLCGGNASPDDMKMFGGKAEVDEICKGLDLLRTACREHPPKASSGDAAEAYMAKRCAELQRLDPSTRVR